MRILLVAAVLTGSVNVASAELRWQDNTQRCIGSTLQWTNKVEVADVDGDGLVDILMANGGDYSTPGSSEQPRIWKNLGNWATAGEMHCLEITSEVVGAFSGLSRVIKAADIDGDGDLDILTGGGHQTQLKLFKRGAGAWTDASSQLPQQLTSVGDLEVGDVDGDGDLDLLLGEWGAGDALGNGGGRTRLYLNDGAGTFTEATADHMPDVLVGMTWDVELVDVDNDWDLDALVSCKVCDKNFLFENDGTGHFTDASTSLPPVSNNIGVQNNYEFEAMDIDGDGDLDLATINDGPNFTETLLKNDGAGSFTDASSQVDNFTSNDDNVVVWLDVDSDGDADLLIGSLGNDRLYLNDGAGNFARVNPNDVTPNDTPSTLGIAAVDLDGDKRLDLVQGQGEGAEADKIELATEAVATDTSPPVVRFEVIGGKVFARVHDHQSPSRLHDWQRVFAVTATGDVDLAWYGEYLWSAEATGVTSVCAIDRAGNPSSADCVREPGSDTTPGGDAGEEPPPSTQPGGCCDAGARPSSLALVLLVGLLLRRRR